MWLLSGLCGDYNISKITWLHLKIQYFLSVLALDLHKTNNDFQMWKWNMPVSHCSMNEGNLSFDKIMPANIDVFII